MRAALALSLLLAAPAASAEGPAAGFARGQIVDGVACAASSEESYALYLPSGYTPERAWPIVYVLDPRSRGALAAETFRAGAEKHGYILASSNNTLSDTTIDPNVKALRALWADTHERFPIDAARVYLAGFSGTVRSACMLARVGPGSIAGIIGAGAGFPVNRPPQKGDPFVFFGTIGDKDFNYFEVMDLEPQLASAGLVHRVEIFDGAHQWPPEPLATRALDWMELQAMKAGARPKDPPLVESLWKEALERARTAEAAGDLFQSHRAWSAAAADFAGLRDTAEAARKAAELAANPALQRELKQRAARLQHDKEFLSLAPAVFSAVDADGMPLTVTQIVARLRIRELRKKAQSAKEPDERAAAQRVLNTIGIQTGYYMPREYMEKKRYDAAVFSLSIAVEVDPERPYVWYNRAAAYARKGDRKRALADLRRAVEKGWKDAAGLDKDPDFEALRKDAEYQEIVRSITPSSSSLPISYPVSPPKPSLPWPLSPGGREGKKDGNRALLFFPLLSLWERRGRGGEGFGAEAIRLASLAAAAPPADLPRGQIIPKIVCAGQPDRGYALYLPSSYRPDRQWPIVFAFDSRGIDNGRELIELLTAGAERFGIIVASSNESSNIVPMEENFRSLSALWTDSHGRLAIDDRRAYAFAFSGMSRFVITAALRAPGTFAGIVGASGGFPLGHSPSRKETPFPFFGMVGEKDFNYYEMLDLESRLAAAGLPHRLEIFDGSHEWPPEDLVSQSFGWLELQAMKRGTRQKDPALIEALWQEDLARARALETAGRPWRAWRTYRSAAADFDGLRDASAAKEKAAAIAANEAFRRDLARRAERDRRDREYLERAPRAFNAVGPEVRPDSVSQLLSELQIPDLKRKAKSQDPEERLSAERVLYAVYIQTGLYLPRSFMERKQWDRAILFLQVAAEIDPESPRIPYRLAAAYAGRGNRKKALESLRKAVEMKGTDLAEIESDPALAPLREDPDYRQMVASLKAKPES